MLRASVAIAALLVSAAAMAQVAAAPDKSTLSFRIDEGNNINSFTRAGKVAEHLLLRSGTEPRILVAFPPGNSDVALWFQTTSQPVAWTLIDAPRPVSLKYAKGRALHGIEAQVAVDAKVLNVKQAVLSS